MAMEKREAVAELVAVLLALVARRRLRERAERELSWLASLDVEARP